MNHTKSAKKNKDNQVFPGGANPVKLVFSENQATGKNRGKLLENLGLAVGEACVSSGPYTIRDSIS